MTALLLRRLTGNLPAPAPAPVSAPVRTRARPLADTFVESHWMTPAIRRNMGVRSRRLMRSGD